MGGKKHHTRSGLSRMQRRIINKEKLERAKLKKMKIDAKLESLNAQQGVMTSGLSQVQ